jgi:hypothetical protein
LIKDLAAQQPRGAAQPGRAGDPPSTLRSAARKR